MLLICHILIPWKFSLIFEKKDTILQVELIFLNLVRSLCYFFTKRVRTAIIFLRCFKSMCVIIIVDVSMDMIDSSLILYIGC